MRPEAPTLRGELSQHVQRLRRTEARRGLRGVQDRLRTREEVRQRSDRETKAFGLKSDTTNGCEIERRSKSAT